MEVIVERVESSCDRITIRQGENSLTVGIMDWYEVLVGQNQSVYFPPQAEVMAGESDNIFRKRLSGLVPLYDKTDQKDFTENAKDRKSLNPYTCPVIMGNCRTSPNSWPIYADGFISG